LKKVGTKINLWLIAFRTATLIRDFWACL